MKNRNILLSLWLLLFSIATQAQDFPEPLLPRRIVNDLTEMFSSHEADALEQKLRHFNDTSSTQIAIATVPSLQGYEPNDYAQRLAEKWGVGQKGKDNGILILLKPKTKDEKGQIAIAVGYGLEGVVPDAVASRIIREEIIPEFQQGNYYKGIDRATTVLIQLTSGEFTAEQYADDDTGAGLILLLFLLIFITPLFLRRRKGYTAGNHRSSWNGYPPIFPGGSGSSRSSFGSFSSGSDSFRGFGGGSFGGGGASGSW